MPPFPERESSILAKLKKKKGPGAVSASELDDSRREGGAELNGGGGADRVPDTATTVASTAVRVPLQYSHQYISTATHESSPNMKS